MGFHLGEAHDTPTRLESLERHKPGSFEEHDLSYHDEVAYHSTIVLQMPIRVFKKQVKFLKNGTQQWYFRSLFGSFKTSKVPKKEGTQQEAEGSTVLLQAV